MKKSKFCDYFIGFDYICLGCLSISSYEKVVRPNFVCQALATNGIVPRYWKNDNTQEVEFIIQVGMNIIPVEVKKGRKVDAISLNNFREKLWLCKRH